MATLKFYLKEKNKHNLHPIFMCYQDRGKKFRFYTKVLTSKISWQNNRLKAISLQDYESNEKLEICEKTIKEIEKEAVQNKVALSIEEVEKKFRERILQTSCYYVLKEVNPVPEMENSQSEFFDYYDQFIEATRPIKTKSTIYHFIGCKRTLQKFEKWLGQRISFSTIDNIFFQKFQSYLMEELNFLNNTVGTHTKNLKVFLNYAMRYKLTDMKFEFWDFKTFKEDVDIIALTEEELFKIYNCKFLKPHQIIARDYLCFECFTGLRFSDIGRIRNENLKDDFIVLKTKKTKDQLYIPLNIFAKEILENYKGLYEGKPLPPSYTNQKTNQYIKEVAEIAKVNELTMVEKFCGSKRITVTKPKFAFISTHTGRRTFITLSHEKGMQIEMIMKITGIKKWDTLKKYLKVSESSKLSRMNEFWNRETFNTFENPIKQQLCHI